MAWGISPKKTVTVPLGDLGTEKYLAIVFSAFENLNWKVSYIDEKGLIAYTPISWESYSEQVTVEIKNNQAYLKSECVGYQGFLTDYGKNEKNIELLINEIEYAAFHFKADEEGNISKFKENFYQHPGINPNYTPLGAKDKLTHLGSIFVPKKNYQVVPWLIIINCVVYVLQIITLLALTVAFSLRHRNQITRDAAEDVVKMIYGGIERNLVLNGQYWRLITTCFSHANFVHLFFNMLALAYIGSIIEGRVGKWNFLGLYIITGVCASLASIGYRYEGMGVGASGAIMGLFGIFIAYLCTSFFDKKARTAFLISTCIVVALSLYPSEDRVDYAAHFGGFISGFILGLFSFWAYTKNEKPARYLIRLVSYSLIFIVAISTLAFIPKYDIPNYNKRRENVTTDLNQISSYFYSNDYKGISRAEKISLLEEKVLPLIKKDRLLVKELRMASLPKDLQKEASVYFNFFEKKLKVYELLYKEYKTEDPQFRKQIDQLMKEINKLND